MLAILGIFSKKEKFFVQLDDQDTASNSVVVEEKVTKAVEKKAEVAVKETAKKTNTTTKKVATKKVVSKKSYANVPFWVKAMENTRNYMSSGSAQGTSEKTFSTDYLLPKSTKSRRLPGGSLKSFLNMSRQMNNRGL